MSATLGTMISPRTSRLAFTYVNAVWSLLVLLILVGCENASPVTLADEGPTGIQLSVAASDLERGDTVRIAAELGHDFGDGSGSSRSPVMAWRSSDPSVATVSRSGLVLAQRDGNVSITAISGALSRTSKFSVRSRGKQLIISPKVDTIFTVGGSLQLTTTALNGSGKETAGVQVDWASLQPSIAEVNTQGVVTALGLGTALIVGSAQDRVDTATVVVVPSAAEEGRVASLQVSPGETEVEVGSSLQFSAMARDGARDTIPGVSLVWSSSDRAVASIYESGRVEAKVPGSVVIRATADGMSGTAVVRVTGPGPVTDEVGTEGDLVPDGDWDRVVEDEAIEGDLVVPAGERWLIGPNVRIAGNVRTEGGTIGMRPGSSLHFVDASADTYVGGGMRYQPEFARDWGIWVTGSGVLDIQGTPKVGWNRTGSDPSWLPDDELWISPTDAGDYAPRRWFPGGPIPQIDPRVPAAEIINVTRDIVIEGPGHIHITSDQPQRIEYVTLRRMGIVNPRLGATSGRYALHLHFMGEGARGTVIRGVAAIDSEGRVFVPHASHGVTLEDIVSVNSFADAFWWDPGGSNRSHDILVDRLAVSGVNAPRDRTGKASRYAGASLQAGLRNEIRNSAVSGVRGGGTYSAGYDWSIRDGPPNVWTFEENLVAHNNAAGTRFWTNNGQEHLVAGLTQYRNGAVALDGAYNNSVSYADIVAIDVNNGLTAHASADDRGKRFERISIEARIGPALMVGGHNLPAERRMEFIDCSLTAGPGEPKILVQSGLNNPWIARFQDCGITPDDIVWENPSRTGAQGSSVIIEGREGSWEVTLQDGRVRVRDR